MDQRTSDVIQNALGVIILLVLAFALADCVQDKRNAPAGAVQSQGPVNVGKCEVPPQIEYEFDKLAPSAQLDAKVAALLADRLARNNTERLLRAALARCVR